MSRDFIFYKGTLQNIVADTLVKFQGAGINGLSPSIPIYSLIPGWDRIVIDIKVTSITGTTPSVIFKGLSQVDISSDITATSLVAKAQDGSTDFVSASITAAGTYRMVCNKKSGAVSTTSTIAALLGLLADVSGTVTDLDAEISVLITK